MPYVFFIICVKRVARRDQFFFFILYNAAHLHDLRSWPPPVVSHLVY